MDKSKKAVLKIYLKWLDRWLDNYKSLVVNIIKILFLKLGDPSIKPQGFLKESDKNHSGLKAI